MRVRQFELRILAVILSVLWATTGLIVLIAYRPGGPADMLVGFSASLPLAVSLLSVVWPPLVRTNRAMAGVVWLGAIAVLLLVPSIGGVVVQIYERTTEPLLPSLEVVYPWAIALVATGLFAGLGLTRRFGTDAGLPRRRIVASVTFALAITFTIGALFAGASLANDAALRNRPADHSRFGPTAATPEPPACNGDLAIGSTAQLELDLGVQVDFQSAGDLRIAGARSGSDVSWSGNVVKPDLVGRVGITRIGSEAWELDPGHDWRTAAPQAADDQLVDATVFAAALTPANRDTAEERGLEFVEGARARHCRISVDGRMFEAAFPQIKWLVGDANLAKWRGQIDYWVFADGEVGMVTGTVNGEANDILPHGIQATGTAAMTATDRGRPATIEEPK